MDVDCVRPDKPESRRASTRPRASPVTSQHGQSLSAASSNAHLSIILNQDGPPPGFPGSSAPSPDLNQTPFNPGASGGTGLGALPIDELELLHHWIISTASTLGTMQPFSHLWQDKLVQLGFQYTYLLDGMLALAAVHKATLSAGAVRERYINLSSQHMDRGLEIYRALIGRVDSDAFTALFCFGCILSIHHLALTQVQEPPDLIVYVCEWFGLLAGLGIILKPHWEPMRNSELGLLILDATRTTSNPVYGDTSNLAGLKVAITYMPSRTDKEGDEKRACSEALAELTKITPTVRAGVAEGQSPLAVVMSWPACVSTQFRTLLMERHPTALGLLEQWVSLLEHCEPSWWTANWMQRMKNAIT